MATESMIDALLDELNDVRSRSDEMDQTIEILRDALSECLAELPDVAKWYRHQELYVVTDREWRDYRVSDMAEEPLVDRVGA